MQTTNDCCLTHWGSSEQTSGLRQVRPQRTGGEAERVRSVWVSVLACETLRARNEILMFSRSLRRERAVARAAAPTSHRRLAAAKAVACRVVSSSTRAILTTSLRRSSGACGERFCRSSRRLMPCACAVAATRLAAWAAWVAADVAAHFSLAAAATMTIRLERWVACRSGARRAWFALLLLC